MTRVLMIAAVLLLPIAASGRPVVAEGEIFARESAPIAPPKVPGLWQFKIVEMVPDGALVKSGQIVVRFDPTDLQKQLSEKQNALNEKISQRESLSLELSDRAQMEQLSVAEARANAEKEKRKAGITAELISGLDYKKLQISSKLATERLALLIQRAKLSDQERRQEAQLIESDIKDLEGDIASIQNSIASLQVAAPRDGVMMHHSNSQGEVIDVGSQVWVGQSIADIPDMQTLMARVQLAERDFGRIATGAAVRVVIGGGAGEEVLGRVVSVASTVRSKSGVRPIPVVDVVIEISLKKTGIRPGEPVRAMIDPIDDRASQ